MGVFETGEKAPFLQAVEEHVRLHREELSDPKKASELEQFFATSATKFGVEASFAKDVFTHVRGDLNTALSWLASAKEADALAARKKATQASALARPTQTSVSVSGRLRITANLAPELLALAQNGSSTQIGERANPIPQALALAERVRREWKRTAPDAPAEERMVPDDGHFDWMWHRLEEVSQQLDQIKPVEAIERHPEGDQIVTLFGPEDMATVRTSIARALAEAKVIDEFRRQNPGLLPYVKYDTFAVHFAAQAPIAEIRNAFAALPKTDGLPDVSEDPDRPASPLKGYLNILDNISQTGVPFEVQRMLDDAPEKIVWPTRTLMAKTDYLQVHPAEGLYISDTLVKPYDATTVLEELTPYGFAIEHDLIGHHTNQTAGLRYAMQRDRASAAEPDPRIRLQRFRAKQNALLGRLRYDIRNIKDQALRLTVEAAAFFLKHEIAPSGAITVPGIRAFVRDQSGFAAKRFRARLANPIDLGGDFPPGISPDLKGMRVWLAHWADGEEKRARH